MNNYNNITGENRENIDPIGINSENKIDLGSPEIISSVIDIRNAVYCKLSIINFDRIYAGDDKSKDSGKKDDDYVPFYKPVEPTPPVPVKK